MTKEDFLNLVDKIAQGTATDSEIAIYNAYFEAFQSENGFKDISALDFSLLEAESFKLIKHKLDGHSIRVVRLWPRIAAAASVFIFLSIGTYFLYHKQVTQQIAKNRDAGIVPGSNKAVLTLSNGHQIILNSARNGQIGTQGGTVINKSADGHVVYNKAVSDKMAIVYNTMSTPRGGQYHLTLSDGTSVWLNAASSIRYPIEFTGKERKVEITGEALFEVVHNAKMPFRVTVNGQTVEDIGTSFNINAYADEPSIKTTLVQGSIRVSSNQPHLPFENTNNDGVTLKPGQQSIFQTGKAILVKQANTEAAIAWKNGFFRFDDADLQTTMREFSRWYNIKVIYEGPVEKYEYAGRISRNSSLEKVLKILQRGGVHFRLEDRTLFVQP